MRVCAPAGTELKGVPNNVEFLRKLVQDPRFKAGDTTTKTGATALVALAPGDTLRFTAFNPAPAGEVGEPISMQMRLYNEQGRVIANSAEVAIPPGEFRTVSFKRDELPLAGEPGTGILQVRTAPLWRFTSSIQVKVTTSLEVMPAPGGTTSGSFKFFLNVETLP